MDSEKYQYKKNPLLHLFFFLIVYFCIQDFVGALLYTNFNLPKVFFNFHLFFGEVILFSLFFSYIIGTGFKIHKGLFPLVIFSILVIVYYFALSSNRFSFGTLKNLRCLLLPVALVYLACHLIDTERKRRKFFYFFIFLSLGLALFGIFETLFVPNKFWFNYVNMSLYLNQIKGYYADYPQLGISGAAMGRVGYGQFFRRRLTSTFGDPFGYAIGMSVSIIIFFYLSLRKRKIHYILGCLVTSLALLLTFTRSGYILFAVVFFIFWLLVLNKKQKIFSMFLSMLFFPFIYNFLGHLILITKNELQTNSAHSRDFISFYTSVIQSGEHWIGMGVGHVGNVESGYTYLMTQLGIWGLILFLVFIFSCIRIIYRKTKQKEKSSEFVSLKCINVIALGILIATLILMNFYSYPFGLTTYMINWIIVGIALRIPETQYNILSR